MKLCYDFSVGGCFKTGGLKLRSRFCSTFDLFLAGMTGSSTALGWLMETYGCAAAGCSIEALAILFFR